MLARVRLRVQCACATGVCTTGCVALTATLRIICSHAVCGAAGTEGEACSRRSASLPSPVILYIVLEWETSDSVSSPFPPPASEREMGKANNGYILTKGVLSESLLSIPAGAAYIIRVGSANGSRVFSYWLSWGYSVNSLQAQLSGVTPSPLVLRGSHHLDWHAKDWSELKVWLKSRAATALRSGWSCVGLRK